MLSFDSAGLELRLRKIKPDWSKLDVEQKVDTLFELLCEAAGVDDLSIEEQKKRGYVRSITIGPDDGKDD